MSIPAHLGGHQGITHKDSGALVYLIETFHPEIAIDLGCGPGGMMRLIQKLGVPCIGIDGDPTLCDKVLKHDFYTGPLEIEPVDLCWSVEFLEHIAEQYLGNVWPVLERCRVVFCTHALPKDAHRRRHENCRTEAYWIDAFESHGFEFDAQATEQVRRRSTMRREFVTETGKIFVRRDVKE